MTGLSKNPELTSARLRAAWTPERRAHRSSEMKAINLLTNQSRRAQRIRWDNYYSRTDIPAAKALRKLKNKFYNREIRLRERIATGNLAVGDEVGPWEIEDVWRDQVELICTQCGHDHQVSLEWLPGLIYGVCIQVGRTCNFCRHGQYPVGMRPWEGIKSVYVSIYRGRLDPIVSYPATNPPRPRRDRETTADRLLHERLGAVFKGPAGPDLPSLGDRSTRGR